MGSTKMRSGLLKEDVRLPRLSPLPRLEFARVPRSGLLPENVRLPELSPLTRLEFASMIMRSGLLKEDVRLPRLSPLPRLEFASTIMRSGLLLTDAKLTITDGDDLDNYFFNYASTDNIVFVSTKLIR